MRGKPRVGMKVRLNAEGLESIKPTTWEDIEAAHCMVITWVSEESVTYPEQTWEIRVDGPLDRFMLASYMVEEVQE